MQLQPYFFVSFLLIVSAKMSVFAKDDQKFEDEIFQEALAFLNECGAKDLFLCFKEKALKYLEMVPNNFNIGGIIQVKQNNSYWNSRNYESFKLPEEIKAREDAINNMLIKRIVDYLKTHTVEFKIPENAFDDLEKSIDEGRKKKNKKGGGKNSMLPVLILAKMKAIAIVAIAIKAIALIAFKALLVAKVALTISVIIALKKLLDHKHTSTLEVVAHPHYDEHSHFERSFGQQLAYGGHETFFTTSSSKTHS